MMLLLSRRAALQFLFGTTAFAAMPGLCRAAIKDPFEIQYTDDTTDLQTNYSPYNDCTPFEIAKLRGSIDEAISAGVDKFVIQPGTGWVPWWKSKFYPAADHYRWFEQTYGSKSAALSSFARYMLSGGDILGEALQYCRGRGIPLYASIRLNDVHGIMQSGATPQALSDAQAAAARSAPTAFAARQFRGLENIARVHQEHPEWRLNPGGSSPADQAWNWGEPQTVEWRRRQLVELCETYDFDGLQLDFMRFPRFFRDSVPIPERRRTMLDFVRAIRVALDNSFKSRRRLSIKIPAQFALHEAIGISMPDLVSAGVDEVVASWHGLTSQEARWTEWASYAKATQLFVELTNMVSQTPEKTATGDPNRSQIVCTPAQLLTTAALARAHGFAGASLFNFVYYRTACALRNRIPAREPPFSVIRQLKTTPSPVDQSFYLGWIGRNLGMPEQLPLRLADRRRTTVVMMMHQFGRSWNGMSHLLLAFGDWKLPNRNASLKIVVEVNGTTAQPIAMPERWQKISENSETSLAFELPAKALVQGENKLSIDLLEGPPIQLAYVELQVSGS